MKIHLPFFMCLAMTTHYITAQTTPVKSFTYLGQTPPGLNPEIFMPGFISLNGQYEFGSIFSKDGKEFYYALDEGGRTSIMYTHLKGATWTKPEKIITHDTYGYNDPFLSPEEDELYFISNQPLEGYGPKKDHDIWYAHRTDNGWSAPVNAGTNINSSYNEYYISFTDDKTMYFSSNKNSGNNPHNYDIYASPTVNSRFDRAIALGTAINTEYYEADVFIAYDLSYVIFCSERPEGLGRGDLYISFKQADGSWTESKNMGEVINTDGHELCPFVTHDGKYFFYTSNQDIYWVDAGVIATLR